MGRRVVVVDPSFGTTLRNLRKERGLSLRHLGQRVRYSHTQLWEWETARSSPTREVAKRLDDALDTGGKLADMIIEASDSLTPDDCDRIEHIVTKPRTIDRIAIESFAAILAHQRRLEDQVGAGPLIVPVVAQLAVVEALLRDACGPIRETVLDQAAQWAQFAGWLHAASARAALARDWYARALEWATEAGDINMIATALSMRGHLAWQAREPGPLIGLSAAALRQAASPGIRALAAQQEARGHALIGDSDEVDRKLDLATELAASAAEHPDREPPWVYFYNAHYLAMQRGLAYLLLGRRDEAVEQLEAGLRAMSAEVRQSEWVGNYLLQLALAHDSVGNRDQAVRIAEEARTVAATKGSERLGRQTEKLARELRL
jgi:transcriptional regulator with XRE-family HTH domain